MREAWNLPLHLNPRNASSILMEQTSYRKNDIFFKKYEMIYTLEGDTKITRLQFIMELCPLFMLETARMSDTIFYYCSQNDTEGLKRLIENGVDVTEKEDGGYTPLHIATYYGFFKCMEILIKAGANVNERNDVGCGGLHDAAWFGTPVCLQLLLEHGADPDIKNNNGVTPLFHAAFNAKPSKECIKILLKYGADPTIKNDYGKTFLDYIQDEDYKKEIEDYIQYISTLDIKEPSY